MSGFKDVVGHSEIIQYIQNAVIEDKVSERREGIWKEDACRSFCTDSAV